MMKNANNEIRQKMCSAGVRQWQVAKAFGTNEFTFSRMLREELPDETKTKIFEIIDRLAKEGGAK